ncbi:MAG: ferrous iron transporter B [Clostridiales bacterium]|nr:ferrous iron transporter B [Clostridiales bacterium]
MIEIALVGNPNSGKSTLFNALTSERQRVGNWTGVTNEIKKAKYKKDKEIEIVDLPGIYSQSATTVDTKTAINYLKSNNNTLIINVIDSTNLKRNLYLTCELIRLQKPIVLAVNMCDIIAKNGKVFNKDLLSKRLGVPVVEISALKNYNLDKLISVAVKNNEIPNQIFLDNYKGDEHQKYYSFINDVTNGVISGKENVRQFSNNADKILMHKIWGIPLFFLIMTAVYYLSINLGGVFGNVISNCFSVLSNLVEIKLNELGVGEWLISLCADAIISSVGGILSFLPQILILFTLLALIEDSGYAVRVVYLFDGVFRKFGLGGKSLMPMIVSCGCTVTGLMSTRIIEGRKERIMTIFLSPFMPCGAKTAVFAYFASAFFNGNALVAASMYFLGIICVGVFGLILKRTKYFKNLNDFFVMEIPPIRKPSIKNVINVIIEKIKEFLSKAALAVFCVSVFLWLLKSVGIRGYVGEKIEDSFLYLIGNAISWIFTPLGFSSWQTSVALLSGTFAKEAIVETLELIANNSQSLFNSTYSAYAFMAFVLLSPPCVASLATAYRELNSKKLFFLMCTFQFVAAYTVAFLINLLGYVICSFTNLILSLIIVIMIIISVVFAIKRLSKSGCKNCAHNCYGDKKCNKKVKRFTI